MTLIQKFKITPFFDHFQKFANQNINLHPRFENF
jgi:hypothetical protein